MADARYENVRAGDWLRPIRMWNETTGNPNRRLADRVQVIAAYSYARRECGACQSGFMFLVRDLGGAPVRLDGHWFYPPTAPL